MAMNIRIPLILTVFFFSAAILPAATGKSLKTSVKTGEKQEAKAPEKEKGYLTDELNSIQNPVIPKAPGVMKTTINLIVSLLFVIGLIYIFMVLLKFFYVKAAIPLKAEGIIKILAKEHIDSKKIMYVVEFAGRVLLLGSAGENLTLLAEITDKEAVEEVKNKADEYIAKYRMKNESKFSEELKSSYLKQGKKIVNSGNDAIKNMIKKLKKSGKDEEQ